MKKQHYFRDLPNKKATPNRANQCSFILNTCIHMDLPACDRENCGVYMQLHDSDTVYDQPAYIRQLNDENTADRHNCQHRQECTFRQHEGFMGRCPVCFTNDCEYFDVNNKK